MDKKRVPIVAVRRLGQEQGLSQVILVGWDGERTHVVTWGKSLLDCEQAAVGGNRVKEALGFPPELCQMRPSRSRSKRPACSGDMEYSLEEEDQ